MLLVTTQVMQIYIFLYTIEFPFHRVVETYLSQLDFLPSLVGSNFLDI